MIVIKDPNATKKTDDWAYHPFIHLALAGGFDHLEKPLYIDGTEYCARWCEAVKTGRYGEGLCARIDLADHIRNDTSFDWSVDFALPFAFTDWNTMVHWSSNTPFGTFTQPNGYDCTLPWTLRAHLYQKPGSNWVISTFYHFYNNNTFNPYIGMMDGELRMWEDAGALQTNTYTVLAVVPNTVNQWYSLELRQEPLVPLKPKKNPTIYEGPGLQYRAITWHVIVNGEIIYTVENCYANLFDQVCQIGHSKYFGNTECFIDNIYVAFMTDIGIKLLESPTWIIRKGKLSTVDCRGEWTAMDETAGTREVGVDYAKFLTFKDTTKAMINDSDRIVYSNDDLATVLRGSYTEMHYRVKKPEGSKCVGTWAVTLEREAITNRRAFHGSWMLQPGRYGWGPRNLLLSDPGMDDGVKYGNNDPYWIVSTTLNPATHRHNVFHKYLPEPTYAGSVIMACDFVGATFPW